MTPDNDKNKLWHETDFISTSFMSSNNFANRKLVGTDNYIKMDNYFAVFKKNGSGLKLFNMSIAIVLQVLKVQVVLNN